MEHVVYVILDIILMEQYVKNVHQQINQIVIHVQQQRINAQYVIMDIIQMAMDVHHVKKN